MIQIFARASRATSIVACSAAAALPAAHAAVVIDFEPAALTGLYFPGETFTQQGFTLAVGPDFGTIDTAAAIGIGAPTGNSSQFYFNSNDGTLTLSQSGGLAFSLGGFAAAFVPLSPASNQNTVIVATGTTQANTQVSAFWSFAPSATSNFPFMTYGGAGFAAFTNLVQLQFKACSLVAGVACTVATNNNGQFALDDVVLTVVPEPGTWLMLATGLLGLGAVARRARR
ncbi:MAG: NF038120 family PEP-CTERM protein [Rubrivivax sp.]